jgi:hypothetical protein
MEGRSGNGRTTARDGNSTNKQERRVMKSTGVDGLPAGPQEADAANEEFHDELDSYQSPTHMHSGWDPYEVWRTRVKTSSKIKEHEADPRR